MASETSLHAPSSVGDANPLALWHHSNIPANVLVARSRDMIIDRWVCETPGHTVCYADVTSKTHKYLSGNDIDEWAVQHVEGNASLKRPPGALLARWTAESDPPCAPGTHDRSLTECELLLDDCESLVSPTCSSESDESSIMPFIGYTAGSAVKGIGNIVIGALEHLDASYRKRRFHGLIAHFRRLRRYHEGSLRCRAFHRVLAPLISPGRQMNGLMNDIIHLVPDLDHRRDIFFSLKSGISANSPYQHMKVEFIWAVLENVRFGHQHTAVVPYCSPHFLCDFDTEQDAAENMQEWLKSAYRMQRSQDMGPDTWESLFYMQAMLYQSLALINIDDRRQAWKSLVRITSPNPAGTKDNMQLILHIIDLLHELVVVNKCERWNTIRIDPHPLSLNSIWASVCTELSECMSWCTSLRGWTSLPLPYSPEAVISDTMDMLDPAEEEHQLGLHMTNVFLPLFEAVPDDVWEAVVSETYITYLLPSIHNVQSCRELALELARDL